MKKLTLFSGPSHGAFTFESVLQHHKEFDKSPYVIHDGVVFLAEQGNTQLICKRLDKMAADMAELTEWIEKTPYNIWTILDEKRYNLMCRMQLLRLARNHHTTKVPVS
jgi:hypothetical protein